jgi:hypothetical protein
VSPTVDCGVCRGVQPTADAMSGWALAGPKALGFCTGQLRAGRGGGTYGDGLRPTDECRFVAREAFAGNCHAKARPYSWCNVLWVK